MKLSRDSYYKILTKGTNIVYNYVDKLKMNTPDK